MTYETANSVVRPPSAPTETPVSAAVGAPVVVNWTAPAFGVVATYTISRSSDGGTPIVIGSVSGINGNPPATTFTDTNPDVTATTVAYTISTTLLPIPVIDPTPRQSAPSPPAILTNNQTIVLGTLPSSIAISTTPLTVTATAETNSAPNGLQVNFTATGTCALGTQSINTATGVSSATVTLNSAGSCTVTASQPGTISTQTGIPPYFNAANSVSGTVTILPQGSNLQSQTINFPQLPIAQYGGSFSLSASSSSGQAVTFAASGPCTITGSITGVGVCAITASAPANGTYSAATVTQSFTIIPAVLKVTANNATAAYGQPIPSFTYTYSGFVNSQTASVISGAPSLSTTATQGSPAGNYPITVSTGTLAAANYSFLYVNGTLTIQPASQSPLTLIATSPLTYNQSETLSAAGGSTSGAVTYTLAGGSCTLAGAQLSANSGTGSCTVTATMAGNSNYSSVTSTPASTVSLSPASQTIAFTINPPTTAGYNSTFTVAAAGGASGNAVIFTSSGSCSNVGAAYKMTSGTGTCSVIANQAGNSNYATAAQVTKSVSPALAAPTVTFTGAPSSAAYKSAFTVATTTNASTTALITSSGACTNSGASVTMTSGTGTCSLTATWAADSNYSGATASQATTASKLAPTVTFTGAPASAAYKSAFTVATTTNASTTAAITSSGACSNTRTAVTMTSSTGTCSLTATWAADGNFSGATATQSTTATLAAQAITFTTNPPASAAYNSSFTVAATGGASGNAVTFTSSGACSNSGATYTMTNSTGTCSVIASQAGNTNYTAATPVTQSVTATGPLVTVSPSSISFGSVTQGSITVKNITVTNIGTASVTVNDPILSIVKGGNSNEFVAVNLCLTPLAAGKSCTITIAFVAGPYYTPQTATLQIMDNAPGSPQPVTLSATVLVPQTITFTTSPPAAATYHSIFTVAATGGASGNAVTFTSSGACTNSGATYTMTSGTGTCSVIANQAGNATYAAASQVTKSVAATLVAQTITFTTSPPASAAYHSIFAVAATGGASGNAVTFTSTGSCSNSGATYTMTSGTGTCSVIASQAGNSNYAAAAPVTKTVTATLVAQTIAFTTNPPTSEVYKGTFTVAATGGASGNSVTFTSSGACTNSGATYTITSTSGTCSVIANQAGNSNYATAAQVTKTVTAN
jgi:phosphotransferase system HPr-like phosphotransfer protein